MAAERLLDSNPESIRKACCVARDSGKCSGRCGKNSELIAKRHLARITVSAEDRANFTGPVLRNKGILRGTALLTVFTAVLVVPRL